MASNTSDAAKTGESVLLLGATGAVGRHVLRELLASNHWTRVVEAGRRVTAEDVLQGVVGKEKLVQKTIDFEKLDVCGLKDEKADVVVIVLGTSKAAAGSAENFIKIDREYVINAAKAAKLDTDQRLLYLSSTGASSSSFFLYPKSKGLTEQGLDALGYKDFIVFRPGLLDNAERDKPRMVETIFSTINGWMPSSISNVSAIPVGCPSSYPFLAHLIDLFNQVTELAKSIVKAAQVGSKSLPAVAGAVTESPKGLPPYHIIFNKGALDLAKTT
ncbi:Protein fmp52, mitochondrial [Tulasnella sp. 332]|nr:Protein fmp52, mitochondrial [Tulasnella sp. 332]